MLPAKAIEAPILELIKSLQNKPYLKGFYLVGGTALALYIGLGASGVTILLFTG